MKPAVILFPATTSPHLGTELFARRWLSINEA
jgi:hypothetical protein